jgi:MFS family permease
MSARGPLALARDRKFGPFFFGKLLSACGNWIQNLAAAVLMFELTGSAFMVGLVSVLQFSPQIVLSLWAGVLSDQFDRRRLVIAGRTVTGTTVSALAVLLAIQGTDGFGGPPVLLATVCVLGIAWSMSNAASHALVPALVPRVDLDQALALSAAAPSSARAIGPAIGAGLLLVGGPAAAFAAAGVGHLAFALMLLLTRSEAQPKPATKPSVLGGIRYLMSDRKAALLVVGVSMVAFGGDPVVTLTPSLAASLGGGDEVVGLLASAFGVGAISLTLLVRRVRNVVSLPQMGIAGYWLLAAGLVTVAFSGSVPVAMAGFLLAGSGFMMSNVALTTRIQRRVPDELRGRVMALWGLAAFGSRPVAAMLNGSVADFFDIRTALVAAAVLCVLASPLSSVTYRDQP